MVGFKRRIVPSRLVRAADLMRAPVDYATFQMVLQKINEQIAILRDNDVKIAKWAEQNISKVIDGVNKGNKNIYDALVQIQNILDQATKSAMAKQVSQTVSTQSIPTTTAPAVSSGSRTSSGGRSSSSRKSSSSIGGTSRSTSSGGGTYIPTVYPAPKPVSVPKPVVLPQPTPAPVQEAHSMVTRPQTKAYVPIPKPKVTYTPTIQTYNPSPAERVVNTVRQTLWNIAPDPLKYLFK